MAVKKLLFMDKSDNFYMIPESNLDEYKVTDPVDAPDSEGKIVFSEKTEKNLYFIPTEVLETFKISPDDKETIATNILFGKEPTHSPSEDDVVGQSSAEWYSWE